MVISRNNKIMFVVLALGLAVAGALTWIKRDLAAPIAGTPCAPTTAEAAAAEGLNFNHTMSSMRDPVNGVLVRAAVGQPYIHCKMVLSTFRCNQQGPATVQVRAGNARGYFTVPEGGNAVLQGDGDGAMSCVLPQ
jgi:hypothetical protein